MNASQIFVLTIFFCSVVISVLDMNAIGPDVHQSEFEKHQAVHPRLFVCVKRVDSSNFSKQGSVVALSIDNAQKLCAARHGSDIVAVSAEQYDPEAPKNT